MTWSCCQQQDNCTGLGLRAWSFQTTPLRQSVQLAPDAQELCQWPMVAHGYTNPAAWCYLTALGQAAQSQTALDQTTQVRAGRWAAHALAVTLTNFCPEQEVQRL